VGALIIPLLSDFTGKELLYNYSPYRCNNWPHWYRICYHLLAFTSLRNGAWIFSPYSGPIGFQYGAEITYPASEGTSNGMLLLMGQISGIAFIFGMDSLKSQSTGSMTRSLIFLIGLCC